MIVEITYSPDNPLPFMIHAPHVFVSTAKMEKDGKSLLRTTLRVFGLSRVTQERFDVNAPDRMVFVDLKKQTIQARLLGHWQYNQHMHARLS